MRVGSGRAQNSLLNNLFIINHNKPCPFILVKLKRKEEKRDIKKTILKWEVCPDICHIVDIVDSSNSIVAVSVTSFKDTVYFKKGPNEVTTATRGRDTSTRSNEALSRPT